MFKIVDDLFEIENPSAESTDINKVSYMADMTIVNNKNASELTDYEKAMLRGIYLVTRFVNENFITNGYQCLVSLSFKDIDSLDKAYRRFKLNNNGKLEQLDTYSLDLIGPEEISEKDRQQNVKAQCMLYGLIGITTALCNKAFAGIHDQEVSLRLPNNDNDVLAQIVYLYREDFHIKEIEDQDILLLRAKPLKRNKERSFEFTTQYIKLPTNIKASV